jgi:hypothetical protein
MFAPITPYAAHLVVNARLVSEDIDKKITPQMMYTYYAKELIAHATTTPDAKQYFDGDSFMDWLDKYIEKQLSGDSTRRIDVNALVAQYTRVVEDDSDTDTEN